MQLQFIMVLLFLFNHQLLLTCTVIDILLYVVVMSLDIELLMLLFSVCISQNFTYKLI
jgi:hypothetical protein